MMASLSPLSSDESESLTPLLDGNTSSTSSIRGDVDSSASSDVFAPRVNRLRPVWRSPVWQFYSLAEDTKFAVCNHCGELVSRGGGSTKSYNTSNLVSHLRSQHPDKYTEFSKLKAEKEGERDTARKERSKAPGISGLRQLTLHGESMDEVKQWDINDARAALVHKKLGEMIALDCQPLTIVVSIVL